MDSGRVLGRILGKRAEKNVGKTFLFSNDQEVTYLDLEMNANRLANGLKDYGLSKGNTVCVMQIGRAHV